MKNILGYIFCILTAVLMAVMIDGKGGILIASILIIAITFSFFLLLFFKNRLYAHIECKSNFFAKDEIVELEILAEKKSFLPSPFIEIELETTDQLQAVNTNGIRFVIPAVQNSKNIKIAFKTFYSGLTEIKIKRMELIGFLGLMHKKVKPDNYSDSVKLQIMPTVHDTGTQSDVIKASSDLSGDDDNEEETSETAIGATGTPGYEHRTYYPGDPIKKINWKISSKRDIYMVRMDEKISVASQIFILDYPAVNEMKAENYANADLIIEGCLAMLFMLSKQGIESELYFYKNNSWNSFEIKSISNVYELAEKLADFLPSTLENRIPFELLKGKAAVCFTTTDSDHLNQSYDLFSNNEIVFVVSENSGLLNKASNIWCCSKNFEFTKIV